MSRYHAEHPYVFKVHGDEYRVQYVPGESDNAMFGGNTNWRGPIWLPINLLIIRALLNFYLYYGDAFRVEFPTGSNRPMNLFEISKNIAASPYPNFSAGRGRETARSTDVTRNFRRTRTGANYINFFEYFNAENGDGLGASHQTGWTGLVAL